MKLALYILATLLTAGAPAFAQVAPAATTPEFPVAGLLHYDLRYSETTQFGNGDDGQQWSIASGDASYSNISKRLPFSLQYGGGYGWSWNGPPSAGNVFQHLALSQGIIGHSWNLNSSDSVSYSFESPTVGFTGVAGTGEPIGGTGSTTSDQTILAQNTRTLDNSTSLGFGHQLGHATSLSLGGAASELFFIDSNGQNTDTVSANGGLSHRLSARNSLSGMYSFSRFIYNGSYSIAQNSADRITYTQTQSAGFGFIRQWSHHLRSSFSAGPQWISSSNSAVSPSTLGISAAASIDEGFKHGSASLDYSHGVSGGAGYMYGAQSDTISANYSRPLGRSTSLGASAAYMRTAGLDNNQLSEGQFAGVQATHKLGRYFNAFVNYTVMDQSSDVTASNAILNHLSQALGFGIGYSPRPIHLRH